MAKLKQSKREETFTLEGLTQFQLEMLGDAVRFLSIFYEEWDEIKDMLKPYSNSKIVDKEDDEIEEWHNLDEYDGR